MRPVSRREQRGRAVRLILERQHGVIHRSQLLAEGLSEGAIARACQVGRLKRVHPSVYLDGSAQLGWPQALMAAHLWCGREGWFSHRTAAALFRLDGIEPGVVEMTLLRKTEAPSGVIVHVSDRLPACDVERVGCFPATTATRTPIDLGAVVDHDIVEMALECALRRRLTTIPRLRWRLDELGGRGRR